METRMTRKDRWNQKALIIELAMSRLPVLWVYGTHMVSHNSHVE